MTHSIEDLSAPLELTSQETTSADILSFPSGELIDENYEVPLLDLLDVIRLESDNQADVLLTIRAIFKEHHSERLQLHKLYTEILHKKRLERCRKELARSVRFSGLVQECPDQD